MTHGAVTSSAARTPGAAARLGPMAWAERGACRNTDPDALFVPGAAQHQAKRICRDCPVRVDCLVEALDNRMEFGIWGGMTERERRAMLRRRPDVESWRPVVDASLRTSSAVG